MSFFCDMTTHSVLYRLFSSFLNSFSDIYTHIYTYVTKKNSILDNKDDTQNRIDMGFLFYEYSILKEVLIEFQKSILTLNTRGETIQYSY